MKNIKLLLDRLKAGISDFTGSYYIPGTWISDGFTDRSEDSSRPGEININPYSFMSRCIESQILGQAGRTDGNLKDGNLTGNSLTDGANSGLSDNADGSLKDGENNGIDLLDSTIYGMFPRVFTAWDHYEKDSICGGTFLKAICRLPYLKRMSIDIIYLLPVFKCSSKYKKGELGSPYSIKNVYKLDPALHDDLLGEYSEELLEVEFSAFVEACHALGMRVMVDFVFRTVSRDNDLIVEHPDWFYWIDVKYNECFRAPFLKDEKKLVSLNKRLLAKLYRSEHMKEYLSMFRLPPNLTDPEKWERVRARARAGYKASDVNILDLVEKEFGITTVPGFSDVLNDPQPPWTDVTYLKLYDSVDESVAEYIPAGQPPYISQDGVSRNAFSGEGANTALWQYISGVIPYYREKFGIDGARIDMGHALPAQLNKLISENIKKAGGDFILWSEEFDPAKAEKARKDGFHFISGYTSAIYRDIDRPSFNGRMFKDMLLRSELPVTGAVETPDTPRAAYIHRDLRRIKQLIMLNSFMPNAIPFINNGFEVMEKQPMNLGLDNSEEGRFVLDRADPMYGRLAFFDNYRLHWLNSEGREIIDTLNTAAGLRRRFSGLVCRKGFYQKSRGGNGYVTFICYFDEAAGRLVFLAANRSMAERAELDMAKALPRAVLGKLTAGGIRSGTVHGNKDNVNASGKLNIIYASGEACESAWDVGKEMLLEPGELIIGCFGF